jgi:hypothetical protein
MVSLLDDYSIVAWSLYGGCFGEKSTTVSAFLWTRWFPVTRLLIAENAKSTDEQSRAIRGSCLSKGPGRYVCLQRLLFSWRRNPDRVVCS